MWSEADRADNYDDISAAVLASRVGAQEKKIVGPVARSFRPLVGVASWRVRPLFSSISLARLLVPVVGASLPLALFQSPARCFSWS